MTLRLELSFGLGQWKPLGIITREGWNELNRKLPKSISRESHTNLTILHIRLIENGKVIDRINRNLK